MKQSVIKTFVVIMVLTVLAVIVALPSELPISLNAFGKNISTIVRSPFPLSFTLGGKNFSFAPAFKKGLDIQGGMQVVLQADMSSIAAADRDTALESARQVILRRVDMYGINEPVVRSSKLAETYRIVVELAGIKNEQEALSLIGTTAELDFRLFNSSDSATATASGLALLTQFKPTGLTGKELHRTGVQFDQQTGKPVIGIEFSQEGKEIFGKITTEHTGEVLGIFLDGIPMMYPKIQTAILDGRAILTGEFTLDEAKNISIQLNAGALPVPITVVEQKSIGPSLGSDAITQSTRAGFIGLVLVMIFMVLLYGYKGFLANVTLVLYGIYTVALYKIMGVTLTVPGIAGLLLSVGMAVDASILVFERMKEELRDGQPFARALELGFGRAWDSIKDANVATIVTALVLINPFNWPVLNTSGPVRGFGVTLLLGVLISLTTGVFVLRTFLRLFLAAPKQKRVSGGAQ